MPFGAAALTLLSLITNSVLALPMREIAFERDGCIYLIHADGTGEERLPLSESLPDLRLPTWSPDGDRLAFARVGRPAAPVGDTGRRACPFCEVYIASWDEGSLRRITRLGLLDTLPLPWYVSELEWEADGKYLEFALTLPYEGGDAMPKVNRYWVAALGGLPWRLSDNDLEDSFHLRRKVFDKFSPDGKWRFRDSTVNDVDELFVLGWGDTMGRQVTNTAQLRDSETTALWGSAPIGGAWSPDGAHILFEPLQEGADLPWGRLFSVNVDGTNQMQLSQGTYLLGDFPKGWSSDGKRLVFEDNDSVCVADFVHPVRKIAGGHTPDWRPGGDRR
jgi:Tol biopolymer transport system component